MTHSPMSSAPWSDSYQHEDLLDCSIVPTCAASSVDRWNSLMIYGRCAPRSLRPMLPSKALSPGLVSSPGSVHVCRGHRGVCIRMLLVCLTQSEYFKDCTYRSNTYHNTFTARVDRGEWITTVSLRLYASIIFARFKIDLSHSLWPHGGYSAVRLV